MGTRSKDRIKAMIAKDILDIYNRSSEVKKSINESLEETLDYLNALIAQIPQSACGPLITKTPKVLRKKGVQRIETIPEDDVINTDFTMSDSMSIKTEKNDMETTTRGRAKRQASKKAADNIRQQQSLSLGAKLRRPSNGELENVNGAFAVVKKKRDNRTKRKKSARSSSDEDESRIPSKHSKLEESMEKGSDSNKLENGDNDAQDDTSADKTIKLEKRSSTAARAVQRSGKKRSSTQRIEVDDKRPSVIDDTVIAPLANDEEPSMYEDAIEKPTPIMNSTMKINSTITLQRMMNTTVVLEPLQVNKLNETVTLKKMSAKASEVSDKTDQRKKDSNEDIKSSRVTRSRSSSSIALQDRMQQFKKAMANKEFDELITDDESSPELKKPKQILKKQEERKRQRQIVSSDSTSEDEVLNTPAKTALREVNAGTMGQEGRNIYKSNALFSPYAKESVKKRVEAFEQAGMNSPKPAIDIDAPTRVTRTKTRAIAAAAQAEAFESTKVGEKTVAQKLARKSLARAKKISLAKQTKDVDEYKENKMEQLQKTNKLYVIEKMNQKQQQQQKTTPLGKAKIPVPMSVNRLPHTPMNSQLPTHYTKAFSATRANIVTSVESFIQPPKTASKPTVAEKLEERKKKSNDDDAKKKREEALRLQTEEKRRKRQEKELKNKLAREAKEKQDMEKRQKAEREREEKARLAQQVQEKQREEMEKKRLAQLQRAQEKEERRKFEEQQRLQRLQEQEEAERILAEQRRREQEAEKRREAEARAQHQAAAEAARIKNQMLTAQAEQVHNKHYGPTNYILDSEPDDESDDESEPKHPIPYWAQPHVRKAQIAIQRYIPDRAVDRFFGARKCTPDLTELFHGIDKSRLKRTSSAIWKTPPRFSMVEAD